MTQKKLQLKTVTAYMCSPQPGNFCLIHLIKQQSQRIADCYSLALVSFICNLRSFFPEIGFLFEFQSHCPTKRLTSFNSYHHNHLPQHVTQHPFFSRFSGDCEDASTHLITFSKIKTTTLFIPSSQQLSNEKYCCVRFS